MFFGPPWHFYHDGDHYGRGGGPGGDSRSVALIQAVTLALNYRLIDPYCTVRTVFFGSQDDKESTASERVAGIGIPTVYSWSEPSPTHTVGGEEIKRNEIGVKEEQIGNFTNLDCPHALQHVLIQTTYRCTSSEVVYTYYTPSQQKRRDKSKL